MFRGTPFLRSEGVGREGDVPRDSTLAPPSMRGRREHIVTHQSRIVGGRGTGSFSHRQSNKRTRRAAGMLGAAALAAATGVFLHPPGAHAANQLWDINTTGAGATDDGSGNADGTWDN